MNKEGGSEGRVGLIVCNTMEVGEGRVNCLKYNAVFILIHFTDESTGKKITKQIV